jgi:hypothetical protein
MSLIKTQKRPIKIASQFGHSLLKNAATIDAVTAVFFFSRRLMSRVKVALRLDFGSHAIIFISG